MRSIRSDRSPLSGRAVRSRAATGLVLGALAATVAALLFPVLSFSAAARAGSKDSGRVPAGSTITTAYGPLTAADRDFLVRVRLADLWGLPAGQQAQERGTSAAVRLAGEHLVSGQSELDRDVRSAAGQLGVDLPTEPDAGQRSWLDRLTAAHGAAYDRLFATLAHGAQGAVLQLAARTRATTANSLVRELATRAGGIVPDDLSTLEQTGLVDFGGPETQATPA